MSIQTSYSPNLNNLEIEKFLLDNTKLTWDEPISPPSGYSIIAGNLKDIGVTAEIFKIRTEIHYLQISEQTGSARQIVSNISGRVFYNHKFFLQLKAFLIVADICPKDIRDLAVDAFTKFSPGSDDAEVYFENWLKQNTNAKREWFEIKCTFTIKKTKIDRHPEELDAIVAFYNGKQQGSIVTGPDGKSENLPESEYLQNRQFRIQEISVTSAWGLVDRPADPVHERQGDGRPPDEVAEEISTTESNALDCNMGMVTTNNRILSFLKFPEFKLDWRTYSIKIGCVWFDIPYPVLQIRWSSINLYGYTRRPANLGQYVEKALVGCFWRAALTGAVIGAALGNLPAALAAFKAVFTECIKEKFNQLVACMVPGLMLITEADGDWADI